MSREQEVTWEEIETILFHTTSNVGLHGKPSLGKSFAAQSLDGYAITIHEGTPADEIRGHFVPAGDKFDWHDGPGIRAWREGVPLVINEINKGSDEVRSILHVICDNPETAKLTLPTGETVRPSKGFRVIATMNGDPSEIEDALRSRFPIWIHVTVPHPDAVSKLPNDLQEAARRTAVAEPGREIYLRSWYAFVQLRTTIGEELALRAVFGQRSEEVRNALMLARDRSSFSAAHSYTPTPSGY